MTSNPTLSAQGLGQNGKDGSAGKNGRALARPGQQGGAQGGAGGSMAPWEQEGVKVCLTWARLHGNQAMSPLGVPLTGQAKVSVEEAKSLAVALSSLCRFLHR